MFYDNYWTTSWTTYTAPMSSCHVKWTASWTLFRELIAVQTQVLLGYMGHVDRPASTTWR